MGDVVLEPHNAEWTGCFERERERVRSVAADGLLGVFHIGSTAVPDLAAKPVLDVLAVYADEAAMRGAASSLVDAGYVHKRDEADWQVLNRFGDVTVVLHLRPRSADAWRDQLVFRDFLREHSRARAEYERAKRAAADAHPDDVDAYTDAKEATIRRLTERARQAGYDQRLPDRRER